MHVAMLVESASPARPSGVERSAAAVIDGLRARGVRVTVLSATLGPTGGHGDALAVDMRARFQILRGYRPWVRSVHEVLRQVAPDVVHGQGLLHNGVAAARWSGCPSVVTAHGDPVQDARWHYPRLALPLLVPLVRAAAAEAVADASALVDVSPDWAVNCPREPRNWVYVPNPVGDAFYGAAPPAPSERVLYFGGGRHIKGLDILLDAWPLVVSAHPATTLHVWGLSADEESALATRCRTTPGCIVEGIAEGDGVAEAMRGGGTLVVPSRYEVAPVAIAEAWAIGLPVVATAVGGVPALARGAAALCEAEDPSALAAEIERALERGGETDAMIAEGRKRAEAHRVAAVADAHIALYERLLA